MVSQIGGVWQQAREVPGTTRSPFLGADPEIDLISCPSAGNCGAAGWIDINGNAFVVNEVNGRWHRAEMVPGLDALRISYAQITSLSCPTAGNCVVGGFTTRVAWVASEVNGRWQKLRRITGFSALHARGGGLLAALSCSSPGNCAAAGDYRNSSDHSRGFVVSEVRGTWRTAKQVPGAGVMNAVSCAPAGGCVADGNADQPFVIAEADGRWGTPERVPGIVALERGPGNTAGIGALSCPAPGHCTAIGFFSRDHGKRYYSFVVSER